MTLGGKTSDEVYFHRFPANRRPRIEPRPAWPRGSPCALPHALVAGKPVRLIQRGRSAHPRTRTCRSSNCMARPDLADTTLDTETHAPPLRTVCASVLTTAFSDVDLPKNWSTTTKGESSFLTRPRRLGSTKSSLRKLAGPLYRVLRISERNLLGINRHVRSHNYSASDILCRKLSETSVENQSVRR